MKPTALSHLIRNRCVSKEAYEYDFRMSNNEIEMQFQIFIKKNKQQQNLELKHFSFFQSKTFLASDDGKHALGSKVMVKPFE